MKATLLYNSSTGQTRRSQRPRIVKRELGTPTKEVAAEMSKMTLFEKKAFAIKASMVVVSILGYALNK